MKIFAVDPGYERSALLVYYPDLPHFVDAHEIGASESGILENAELLLRLRSQSPKMPGRQPSVLVVEKIESYGMSVGREVFDTCIWIGRFVEAWGGAFALLPRREIKLHLCNSARAKDANVRQALLDRFGPPGTKKAPGKTYGIHGDLWSALAVAVTYADRREPGTVAIQEAR